MQCPRCGTVNPEGAKFCRGCGNALTTAAPTPTAEQAVPAAAPAPAAPPRPGKSPSRLGQILDPADLLLALVGTGVGALAGILSNMLLPRLSLQLAPFALTVGVTVVALLASFLVILLLAYGVFMNRASQRNMKLKRLIQKEKVFFMTADGDVTVLVRQRGKQNA